MKKVYCPYCGKPQSNDIETELQIFPNKRNRIVCEHCGREFWGYVYVNYEYRTEKKDDLPCAGMLNAPQLQ